MECVNWLFGALSYTFPPMETALYSMVRFCKSSPPKLLESRIWRMVVVSTISAIACVIFSPKLLNAKVIEEYVEILSSSC